MAAAVFDTVSLILLAKIELLELLVEEFELHITGEVESEATAKDNYDSRKIEKQVQQGKIKVETVESNTVERISDDFSIDSGEASTIALYRKIEADVLVTDDGQTIKTCKVMDVNYTTSLNLLARTCEKGKLGEEKALAKLEKLDEYGWYDSKLIEKTRERIRG